MVKHLEIPDSFVNELMNEFNVTTSVKKYRRNKKQEYINGLNHDIENCERNIASPDLFNYWHGKRYSRGQFRRFKKENQDELAMIMADKNYKPWKEKWND